jgi:hypothetical protein
LVLNGNAVDHRATATLCIDMVAMLGDNGTLEVLDIHSLNHNFSPDNYFNALESLQTNTTLKTLRLHPNLNASLNPFLNSVSEDGRIKHLISLVKKNYGLENLDEGLSAQDETGDKTRRYLIEEQDAGSIAKGVDISVAVRDDLACLFYLLLENPVVCDLEHRYMVTGTIADGPVHSKRPSTSK